MRLSEKSSALVGFLLGSLLLTSLSVLQRLAFNITSFEPHSFVTPFFVGGALGAGIGYLLTRFYSRTEEIEKLVKGRMEEVARFEREKEVALEEQERITQEIINQSKLVDTLLAALPAPVFFKNPDGKYQGCNKAFEDLVGITAEELRGKTAKDIYDEKSASLFSETDRSLTSEGGKIVYETTIVNRCGVVRDVQVTKTTYHLSDGSLGGFLGVILDITETKKNQKALAETADRLDLALKGADMGFWDWNILTGEVVYSDRFLIMLGYSRSDVVNNLEWWQRLVHPQDSPRVWQQIEKHLQGGYSSITVEYRLKSKSGDWVWMRARGKVVEWDEKKRPARAAGTQINITSSKAVREALENQNSLMQSLLSALPSPVFFKDIHGCYLGVNKAYEEFSGLKTEDVRGKKASELWDPLVADKSNSTDDLVLKHNKSLSYEITRKNSLGQVRNCFISKAPFFKSDGTVNGLIGIITDITGRKQVEDALAESEEKYRTVVEYAGQMIAITQNGKPVFVNRKFNELTGFSEAEIKTDGLSLFMHADDLGREAGLAQDSLTASNLIPTTQYRIVTKTGDTRWCEEQTVLINWKSQPATLHFITDITDRKKAESILLGGERLKAVADLASGVAHNFNNMLQIIMGGAGLALMDLAVGDTERVQTQLKQIIESARFGAGAVRRLEDFANISSKSKVGAMDVFDVSDLVRRAIDMTELWWRTGPEKDGHKIAITTDLVDGLMTKVQEDDLFEVLINIIKNATEALPSGGTIRLSSGLDNGQVVITIQDDGVGIPKENLAKIFEPFWTTKGFKATGMGLSGSLGIIKRYNGDITISSEQGKGTSVRISLPAETVAKPQPEIRVDMSHVDSHLRILVVDDMEMLVELLRDGLSEYGHTVFTALSGSEAIDIFKNNQIDLVVSDLGMPNITGWELGKEIKRLCQTRGVPKIPFVLLTGWGNQQGEEEKIIESGVDEVVMKPVDLGNLLAVIDRIAFSRPSGDTYSSNLDQTPKHH